MARGQALPLEKIDEMWAAFQERQSYNHVAITTGVGRATAKRYAELGDEARGVEPFWRRLQRQVRETHRRIEKTTIYTDSEQQRAIREQVMLVDRVLMIAVNQMLSQIRDRKITFTSFAKLWKTRCEIVKSMVPFEKQVIEETSTSMGYMDDWSSAEIAFCGVHGRRPTEKELAEFRAQEGGYGNDGEPIDVEAEHQRWGADDDEEDDE